MLKHIANEVWAFDAEWVSDSAAGRLLYDLPADLSEREEVQAMWHEGGATEKDPKPFLKLALSRVVSIAAVIRKAQADGPATLELRSRPTLKNGIAQETEAEMLHLFLEDAIGARARMLNNNEERGPQLVGFNSRAADLPILIQRAIIQGVTAPDFCRRPDKPWEGTDYFARYGDDHVDLKDAVSSFGKGTPSLHELATLSGIPGKLDADGQAVADMWLKGDIKGIVAYNECDALTTYLVWLRIAHFAGFFDADQYVQEQALVRDLITEKLQQPGTAHLQQFLHAWDRLQAATGHV